MSQLFVLPIVVVTSLTLGFVAGRMSADEPSENANSLNPTSITQAETVDALAPIKKDRVVAVAKPTLPSYHAPKPLGGKLPELKDTQHDKKLRLSHLIREAHTAYQEQNFPLAIALAKRIRKIQLQGENQHQAYASEMIREAKQAMKTKP